MFLIIISSLVIMPEEQEGEKNPPTRGETLWRRLMLVVLVYQYAQMLQSTAAKLYAEFRARREPGVVAPSVTKESLYEEG